MPSPVTTTRLISRLRPETHGPIQETGGDRSTTALRFYAHRAGRQLLAFFSRNFVASPTVKIVSAAHQNSHRILLQMPSQARRCRDCRREVINETCRVDHFMGSTPSARPQSSLTARQISLIVQPRACSIGPDPKIPQDDYEPSCRKLPSQSRIVLDSARGSRPKARRTAGVTTPIYRFQILQWPSLRHPRGFGYLLPQP